MSLHHGLALFLVLLCVSVVVGFVGLSLHVPPLEAGLVTIVIWLPFIDTIVNATGAPDE